MKKDIAARIRLSSALDACKALCVRPTATLHCVPRPSGRSLHQGKHGAIFKAAIFTEGKLIWRSYPANMDEAKIAQRAAAHTQGGVVIWYVQGRL